MTPRFISWVALAIVYTVWGSTFFVIRVAVTGFPPLAMCALRYLIAGGAMYGFLRLRGVPSPTMREWRASVIASALLLMLGNGLVAWAEQWVPSSIAAMTFASVPLWAALFSGLWGRWPRAWEWVSLGVGAIGVLLLQRAPTGAASIPKLALAAVVVAAAALALGAVWSRHLALPKGAMSTASQLLVAGVVLAGVSIGSGERIHHLPSMGALLALAHLIVLGSIAGFTAYVHVVRVFRPAIATSNSYVNPVVALLLGVGFAGERVSRTGLVGLGLVFVAMALLVTARPIAESGRYIAARVGRRTDSPLAARVARSVSHRRDRLGV